MNMVRILRKGLCLFASLAWLSVCGVTTADALNFDLGNEAKLDMDVSLTYGASWRVKDQDDKLLSDINADDGNRNFDKGDMVNNKLSGVVDMDLQYKEYGVFARSRAYFDWAYDGSNANDSLATNNLGPLYGGPLSNTDEFSKDTQDLHRDKIELLDLFAYGTFDVADHATSARVGRQVLSWGESVFLQNSVSSAMSPLDATAANAPGVELKEIFLPVGQVTAQTDISSNLTVAGFYQWEWDKTRLDETGAYFSTSDLVDDAAERILVDVSLADGLAATIDKTSSNDPSDDGQWGLSARYLAEGLQDTEFGFYYMNYHEKVPMLKWRATGGTPSPGMIAMGGDWGNLPVAPGVSLGDVDPVGAATLNFIDTSSYYIDYAEDVQLVGFSVSGIIGETNVAGEVSYRMDYPIEVVADNPLGFDFVDGEALQAQVSVIHLFGGGLLWDNLSLLTEFGLNTVSGEGSAKLNKDRTAWGGTLQTAFEYFQIFSGADLKIPVTLKYNGKSVSSVPGTFQEYKDSLGISFDVTYLNKYQFGIGYVEYLHSASKNPLADRDMITAKLKYTF